MPFKIVLIVSAARSGSTIISMKLAQKFGLPYYGEISHFWNRGLYENHLCGCGARFHECPFWMPIRDELAVTPEEGLRIKSDTERLLGQKYSINPFRRKAALRVDEAGLKRDTRRLYEALAAADGADLIVDSSKHPIYARFLIDIFGRDRVRIVHIVRDPRGVAYSMSKKKPKLDSGAKEAFMIRRSSFRSAVGWLKTNFSASRLAREVDDYRALSYEDFCNDPDGALAPLALASGAHPPEPLGKVTFHTVSGNPVRVSADLDRLKPDTEWKDNMPLLDRLVVSLISLPLRLQVRSQKGER